MLLYHHCRALDSVVYGEIKSDPRYSDSDFKPAYIWLEKEVGFYPLFLSIGDTEEDIRMTGYQNQFSRRREGEGASNSVLFSFHDVKGIFTDYQYWHIALNASMNGYDVTDYEKRLIFKPSWRPSKWLRMARQKPHSVQLVAKELYLPGAARIWVRNKQTKGLLEDIGFENVQARMIKADSPI